MEKVRLKSIDDYELDLNIYESDENKGIIQIIHGMEEHQDRYSNFAKFLNDKGYTVITSNVRGHGENSPLLGFFANKNGSKLLIKDQEVILNYIKDRYKVKTINLFAHSMGTIISRNLLQENSKSYDKVVLSGYPNNRMGAIFGKLIANIIILFRGPEYYSKFLHNIAIDSFNKKVENPKTNLDWLSYNEENVKVYLNDEYCGNPFKVSALRDLFVLVRNMNTKNKYHNINKDLKILMIRGKDDPCTGFDKGSNNSINALKKVGFENIRDISYKGMRHEILNEKNNLKVYNDIVNFYK